jgi:hypothetical protein
MRCAFLLSHNLIHTPAEHKRFSFSVHCCVLCSLASTRSVLPCQGIGLCHRVKTRMRSYAKNAVRIFSLPFTAAFNAHSRAHDLPGHRLLL